MVLAILAIAVVVVVVLVAIATVLATYRDDEGSPAHFVRRGSYHNYTSD